MFRKLSNVCKSVANKALGWFTSPRGIYCTGEPFFRFVLRRRRWRQFSLALIKRVLVVRLDRIGDVVMTTPLLRELRRLLPEAWISLVVKPAVHNLVELCPYVNEVIIYHSRTGNRFSQLRRYGQALGLAGKYLWRRGFDLTIVPRWDVDYYDASLIAYLSGAYWRVAYSEKVNERKRTNNLGFDLLFNHVLNSDELQHEVEKNLEVIRSLGGSIRQKRLELWVGEDDKAFAESVYEKHNVAEKELVVGIGPGGGSVPMKQWPTYNFVELGRWLIETYDCRILVVGGQGEEMLGREIEQALGLSTINVVGQTTLRQMAALLRRCNLYVGNDSGPMHVATAMNIPVVALFFATCPHRFSPWGNGHKILSTDLICNPCSRLQHMDRCPQCLFTSPKCILAVSLATVKESVSEQLP